MLVFYFFLDILEKLDSLESVDLRSFLLDFLDWLRQSILSVLPNTLLLSEFSSGIIVVPGAEATSAGRPITKLIHLDGDQFIIRQLSNQRMRASYAKKMMEIDFSIKTPFKKDNVHLVGPFCNGDGHSYVIVKRSIVKEVFDQFRKIESSSVKVKFGEQGPVRAILTDADQKKRFVEHKFLGLALGFAILAAAGTGVHAHYRNVEALSVLNLLAENSQQEARDTRALLDEGQNKILSLEAVQNISAYSFSVSETWEDLARSLPDTVYLTGMAFRENDIQIEGFALQAAGLLPLLESVPKFNSVEFTGPIVNVPGQSKQRFSITMDAQR